MSNNKLKEITDGKITVNENDYSPLGIAVRGAWLGKKWFEKLLERDEKFKIKSHV